MRKRLAIRSIGSCAKQIGRASPADIFCSCQPIKVRLVGSPLAAGGQEGICRPMEAKRDQKMSEIIDLDPHAVRAGLDGHSIVLVDVRETHEFAARSIPGSVNLPLSRFDPADLPVADGKTIVFMCAGGVRSARAIEAAAAAGLPWNQHLAGGINAWVQAGQTTK